jgi:hypothetical protein
MRHVALKEAARPVTIANDRLGAALTMLSPAEQRREAQTKGGRAVAVASKRLGAALATLNRANRRSAAQAEAARMLHLGAGVLALSVLADSGVEHYRGSFENRAMATPLLSASLSLIAALGGVLGPGVPRGLVNGAYRLAEATGVAGLCFHAYNILKRPGGLSWLNLFYAAPIGAPMALTLAGFFGRSALRVSEAAGRRTTLFGVPAGRLLAGAVSVGLAGTFSEAGLMHFRGAYHNPAMYLPVSIPPVAAGLIGVAAVASKSMPRLPVRASLWLTAALGVAGVGFHAYGVSRNMGGWRNWSQNVLNGPPLPAPPGFLGLALVGIAALALMDSSDG